MLTISFNCTAFANPLDRSQSSTNQVSPPPIEAILANVRIKRSIQSKIIKSKVQPQIKGKLTTKLTRSNQAKVVIRQSNRKQPTPGRPNLFNIDRATNRYDNFTAVNRLIE